MPMLDDYERKLLTAWEEVHKKSQLTLWLLLALKTGPKHMAAIKAFVYDYSQQTISADDKSLYRALRRLQDGELLDASHVASGNGPDHKVYQLTEVGHRVLQSFVQRNIIDVIYSPRVQTLIREET